LGVIQAFAGDRVDTPSGAGPMCKHRRMNADDDPEARIRELERSLNERAHASELTKSTTEFAQGSGDATPYPSPSSGQYHGSGSYPPAPPVSFVAAPVPYASPYPQGPLATSGGAGARWLVIGVLTAVTFGVIGGAGLWAWDTFSEVKSIVSPSQPTVSGGGGPFGEHPTRTVGEPVPSLTAPAGEDGPAQGGDYSVSGVGENRSFDCNDGLISVSGVSNTVMITGRCVSITVSGFKNVVTVARTDVIVVSGFDNRVNYLTGAPEIQNSGDGNIIEAGG